MFKFLLRLLQVKFNIFRRQQNKINVKTACLSGFVKYERFSKRRVVTYWNVYDSDGLGIVIVSRHHGSVSITVLISKIALLYSDYIYKIVANLVAVTVKSGSVMVGV